MSDPDRPSTAKLDTDDLELLIGAIEGLSAKVDAIEKNAPVFSPDQAIRLSTAFAAKAENTAQQNLAPVLSQIETATAKLEKETSKATFHERQGRLSDTEKVIRDNHWWRLSAVAAVVFILAGAWLGHGVIVRTVTGCFVLGGEFLGAQVGSGNPDVCFFGASKPR